MALQGSLNELSVLEVMQLIGTQRKSTTLKLNSGSEEVQLHFREGLLIASHAVGKVSGHPFLDTLVALSHLSPAEAISIADQAQAGHRDLWKTVCEVSHLTSETCEEVYLHATEATIDRILLWDQGRFALNRPATVEGVFKPGLTVDSLLLDAMRRLDEIASHKQETLPPSAIPCMSGTGEFVVSSDPLRRAVLRQVDGRRTVQEIVVATRLGEYDIYSTITEGIEAGSIQLLKSPSPSAPTAPASRELLRRWPAVLLLAGLLALGVGSGWLSHRLRNDRYGWETTQVYWEEIDLRRMIETYRHREGIYPDGLDRLLNSGFPIDASTNERWIYRADGEHYLLLPRTAGGPATDGARSPDR